MIGEFCHSHSDRIMDWEKGRLVFKEFVIIDRTPERNLGVVLIADTFALISTWIKVISPLLEAASSIHARCPALKLTAGCCLRPTL